MSENIGGSCTCRQADRYREQLEGLTDALGSWPYQREQAEAALAVARGVLDEERSTS